MIVVDQLLRGGIITSTRNRKVPGSTPTNPSLVDEPKHTAKQAWVNFNDYYIFEYIAVILTTYCYLVGKKQRNYVVNNFQQNMFPKIMLLISDSSHHRTKTNRNQDS